MRLIDGNLQYMMWEYFYLNFPYLEINRKKTE
jgi:hypothetical protein